MKTCALLLILGALSGCASGFLSDSNPDAAYFLISQGNAGGPFKWLSGGVTYCKVTQSGLGGSEFMVDVKYDGSVCTVEGTSANRP